MSEPIGKIAPAFFPFFFKNVGSVVEPLEGTITTLTKHLRKSPS